MHAGRGSVLATRMSSKYMNIPSSPLTTESISFWKVCAALRKLNGMHTNSKSLKGMEIAVFGHIIRVHGDLVIAPYQIDF